ncbi:hypothetical protein PROFUN_08792 [Planoprotostelium fungivorum]|uniref:Uncharacterized protein n=1 Tax=Planoprotostelium fungivorum TaxID=1890364 RepID=A0A2P6MVQ3_9EUKA|nr:hypothetical protein PROFUN_08792 [Planoprotostelium fungivorum]
MTEEKQQPLTEVLAKQGILYSEIQTLNEIVCKPKIMAIKSPTLLKMEEMQRQATLSQQAQTGKEGDK